MTSAIATVPETALPPLRERWTLPGQPSDVPEARRITRDFLHGHGLNALIVDDVTLIINELVTNSVVHGSGPVEVILTCREGTVQGAVTDQGSTMPTHRADGGADDEHGRGLAIVASLADRWGCSLALNSSGKTVWFQVTGDLRGRKDDHG